MMAAVVRCALLCALLLPCLAVAQSVPVAKVSAQASAVAREAGRVRVLVALDIGEHANALPGEKAAAIALLADSVLAGLPRDGYAVKRRFVLVPALALEVGPEALELLAADPAVLRIDVDTPGKGAGGAPDEASVLNGVAALLDVGLDGAGQKVVIVDTGVDIDHPDLSSRLVDGQCFCSAMAGSQGCCPNGQNTQSGLLGAIDDHGHGTNVSGIIVGEGNIAPRGALPAAQLVAVKVLDDNNEFCCTSDVIAALDWILVNHPDADAVNLGLGTADLFPPGCDRITSYNLAMGRVVDALTAQGIVVTAPTGNGRHPWLISAPACLANAVAVGATWDFSGGPITHHGCTETSIEPGQPACFSNDPPDLFAAGAMVTATGNDGGTSTFGGTSQAAAMVAACAAALKQAAPQSTPADRIEAMRLSPTHAGTNDGDRPVLDCMDAVSLFVGTRAVYSDFDGDQRADLVWRHASRGSNLMWHSADPSQAQTLAGVPDVDWEVVAIGDFDGDGLSDLLWRNSRPTPIRDSPIIVWESANSARTRTVGSSPGGPAPTTHAGDFDGDQRDEVAWQDGTGQAWIAHYDADSNIQELPAQSDPAWRIVAAGDLDGDGSDDLLWRHSGDGRNEGWLSADTGKRLAIATLADLAWEIAAVGDFDGDGRDDLFWRHAGNGNNVVWPAGDVTLAVRAPGVPRSAWQVVASGDYDGDGRDDVFWRDTLTGANLVWPSADAGSSYRRAGVADLDWEVVRGMR